MNISTRLQITIITQTIEGVLELSGWTLEANTLEVPVESYPRGPGRDVRGRATKDGVAASLSTAEMICDEFGKNETMRVTMLSEGGEPIRAQARITTAMVAHVPGATPRLRPPWATKANADRARSSCIEAGATNGDIAHARVLHGIGEPPSAVLDQNPGDLGDGFVRVIFSEVKDSPDLVFVEVEDSAGRSFDAGPWTVEDGRRVLTSPTTQRLVSHGDHPR